MPAEVPQGRFRIRQAGLADLADLARVKARAWRETYAFDDAVFDTVDAAVNRTAEHWAEQAARGAYFWAVVDTAGDPAEFVGVAQACPARDSDAPEALELAMIYLLDVAKGSGIADRLLEITIGDAPAYLWVVEGNERAIRFYQRHGFVLDGTSQALDRDLSHVTEMRMTRS